MYINNKCVIYGYIYIYIIYIYIKYKFNKIFYTL